MKCICFLFMLTTICTKGQDCDLIGNWYNDQESVMTIDSVDNANRIYGYYASSTGVDGQVFPLIGWINKDGKGLAISFSVHWGEYGSITSWTGYVENGDDGCEIYTLWHLIRPDAKEVWERILTRSSVFKRDAP